MLHVPRLTGALPRPVRRLVPADLPAFQPIAHPIRSAVRTVRCGAHLHAEAWHLHIREHRIPDRGPRQSIGAAMTTTPLLDAPEVIVSATRTRWAGAWEQEQTFARVLARKSGLQGAERGDLVLRHRARNALTRSAGCLAAARAGRSVQRQRSARKPYIPEHTGTTSRSRAKAEYDNVRRYYGEAALLLSWQIPLSTLHEGRSGSRRRSPISSRWSRVTPADEAVLFINALAHAGHAPLDGVQRHRAGGQRAASAAAPVHRRARRRQAARWQPGLHPRADRARRRAAVDAGRFLPARRSHECARPRKGRHRAGRRHSRQTSGKVGSAGCICSF